MARHSLRSALRTLQGEGIVQIEPNRGARVKSLSAEDVRGLSELRTALEVEARGWRWSAAAAGCPRAFTGAPSAWRRCAAAAPAGSWGAVAEAHEALHHEIVLAADSPRLAAAHQQAGAELRLFVLQLPPSWTLRAHRERPPGAGPSARAGGRRGAPPAHRGIDAGAARAGLGRGRPASAAVTPCVRSADASPSAERCPRRRPWRGTWRGRPCRSAPRPRRRARATRPPRSRS